MKIKSAFLTCATLLSFIPLSAWATKFGNQYTEFELPPNWQCTIEHSEWVCQSTEESKKREAIIVLAAKLKGDQDSLDQYLAYLKNAKTFTSAGGQSLKSDPKYAKMITINGQAWVDALHLESEIPGFFTRYLATVKDDIGVLVTYSISKNKYQDYVNQFENMVNTLKVFRKPGGLNAADSNSNLMAVQIPTSLHEGTVFPGGAQTDPNAGKKKHTGGLDDTTFYLIVGGGAAGIFIFLKKRRG